MTSNLRELAELEVRGLEVSQELLEALVAVLLGLVVRLVLAVLEALPAVGADEALGVELAAGEGGDDPAADAIPAHLALVLGAVVGLVRAHLLEEGAPGWLLSGAVRFHANNMRFLS